MTKDKKKKVLIVDDETSIREIYKKEFNSEGFQVLLAADGEEGLLKAGEDSPHLILLDVMLPKMNGIDVLKALKKNPLTKDIPILLLTNLGEETIIKEGFTMGAEGYLLKVSYTPAQVVAECRKFLDE
ncbi:response regulator [Patescibacteria group bacterium]|nr:response regulator [Patescibacteria group bacterium]